MPGTNGYSTIYDDKDKDKEKKEQQEVETDNTPSAETKTPAPPAPTTTEEQTDIIDTDNSTDAYLQRQQAIGDKYARASERYDAMLGKLEQELEDQKKKQKKSERLAAGQNLLNGIADFAIALSDIKAANNYAPHVAPKQTLSEKSRARAEKAKANYNKDRAQLMAYYDKVQSAKDSLNKMQEKEQYDNDMMQHRREQIDLQNRRYYLDVRRQDWREKYQQGTLDLKVEQQKIDKDFKDQKISIATRNAATNELRAYKQRDNNSDEVVRTEETDEMGHKKTKQVVKSKNGNKSTTQNSGTTPPSKQEKQNDNTPPSRRK